MYIFKKPQPLGKAKKRSKENLRLLNMLNRYITDTAAVPVSILTRFWADQAAAITYKEIRKLIEDEDIFKIIKDSPEIEEAAKRLIDTAKGTVPVNISNRVIPNE